MWFKISGNWICPNNLCKLANSRILTTWSTKIITLFFFWPPLEVGVGYRGGTNVCLGRTGVGFGNNFCASGGKDSTVRQFSKIVWTDSIAANCEWRMLVGTYLSASYKKCIVWVIVSSAINWGWMRYACKYLAVSVIINDLVFCQLPGWSGSDGVTVLH